MIGLCVILSWVTTSGGQRERSPETRVSRIRLTPRCDPSAVVAQTRSPCARVMKPTPSSIDISPLPSGRCSHRAVGRPGNCSSGGGIHHATD